MKSSYQTEGIDSASLNIEKKAILLEMANVVRG